MTTVTFHHGAQDKWATACRLAQDCFREGRRVLVYAPNDAVAARFDQQLWTHAALSFVPHCRAGSPVSAETPILISPTAEVPGWDEVLLNLSREAPAGFERFREVIELVGTQEEDIALARQRFRHYRDSGHPPQSAKVAA